MTSLLKWVVFTVILGLAPLFIDYISVERTELSIQGFLKTFSVNGELLIVAAALAGDGLSETLNTFKTLRWVVFLAAGLSLLIIILSCLLFPQLARGNNLATLAQKTTAQQLFIGSLVISSTCKTIRAIEDTNREQ